MKSTFIAKAILKSSLLSKKRQALLVIAFLGLFLSSFSLLTISSAMKGLQDNVKYRSKELFGHAVIFLQNSEKEDAKSLEILTKIQSMGLKAYRCSTHEVLISSRQKIIKPVILNGIDLSTGEFPYFSDKFHENMALIISSMTASNIKVALDESISVIAPQVSDELFGEIPRSSVSTLENTYISDVSEFDEHNTFVRANFVHNIFGKVFYNRIVILSKISKSQEEAIKNIIVKESSFKLWEQIHQSLNWALSLESSMMLVLFSLACLLISISIIAGLLLYFDNIKRDLASLFILGMPSSAIRKELYIFSFLFNSIAIVPGIVFSFFFMKALNYSGFLLMSDLFIDRTIPFKLTVFNIVISFGVPWIISMIASFIALNIFFKDLNPVRELRS